MLVVRNPHTKVLVSSNGPHVPLAVLREYTMGSGLVVGTDNSMWADSHELFLFDIKELNTIQNIDWVSAIAVGLTR